MKTVQEAAVVAMVITLAGCSSMPEAPIRPNYGPEPSRAEAQRLALEYLKPRLKDPDSVKQFDIVSVRQMQYFNGAWESGFRVCFEYNAKNSYGAYGGLSHGGLIVRCDTPDRCVRYSDGGRFETERCLA